MWRGYTVGFLRQYPSLTTHHMRISWRRARSCASYSLLSEVLSTLVVFSLARSVLYLICGTLLRPILPAIIELCGGNVGMP